MSDPARSDFRPLRLELKASPALTAAVVAVHGAAALGLLTVLTGWSGHVLAALVTALGVSSVWDRTLLRARGSPGAIEIHADGSAKCLFKNGEAYVLARRGGGSVTRFWVALDLAAPMRKSLFVPGDMLAPGPLRLLRLWALWGQLPGAPDRAFAERFA